MKKIIKIALLPTLLTAAVATSCQNEEALAPTTQSPQESTLLITAGTAETRSGMDELTFMWKTGDELKVKTDNETLTMTLNSEYNNQSVGEFTATTSTTPEGYAYVVYHSDVSQVSFSDNSTTFTLPTEQVQKNGYVNETQNYYYSTSLGEYTYLWGKSTNELSEQNTSIDVTMKHVMTIVDIELSNLPSDKELHYLTLTPSYNLNATATVDIEQASVEYTNATISSVSVKLQTSNDAGFVASSESNMTVRIALLPHQIPADATWTISLSIAEAGSDTIEDEMSIEKSFSSSIELAAGVRNKALVDYEGMEIVDNTPDANDYVDEYGINHGAGIEIGGVIWAPVNCGYNATTNKYGKLYQWGRIYGGGWSNSANTTTSGNDTSSTVQTKTTSTDKVDAATANSAENSATFYCGAGSSIGWQEDNSAESWSSDYDPCPEGWRVPEYTYTEMRLFASGEMVTTYVDNYYTSETVGVLYTDTDSGNHVFLPAAGYRSYGGTFSDNGSRASSTWYWTSASHTDAERGLYLKLITADSFAVGGNYTSKSAAMPIRCVKESADALE